MFVVVGYWVHLRDSEVFIANIKVWCQIPFNDKVRLDIKDLPCITQHITIQGLFWIICEKDVCIPGDENDYLETRFAIRKLLNVNLVNRYDVSGSGFDNDYIPSENYGDTKVMIEHRITIQNTDN